MPNTLRPSVATLVALLFTLVVGVQTTGAARFDDDNASPRRVWNLLVTDAEPTELEVRWRRSHDNVGIEGYSVYLDGTLRDSTDATAYRFRSLACGVSYLIGVEAFDAAGNRSSRTSVTASTAACRDDSPPAAPSGIVRLAATETSVALGWSASSDDSGVVEYGLYVGGFRVTTVAEPTATLSNLACGQSYLIGIDAADAAGNRSGRTEVSFSTLDCPDDEPPSTPTNLVATDATTSAISISWSPSSDNLAVSAYGIYVGGTRVRDVSTTAADVPGLECGTAYVLGIDAADSAGNRSNVSSVVVSTAACDQPPAPSSDTLRPSAPQNLSAPSTTQTRVLVAWDSATDNVGVALYRVYRNGTEIGEGPGVHGGFSNEWADSGLSCGTSYTYSVEALDAAGNVGPRAALDASTSPCSAADTSSPTTPTSLTATTRTATSVVLSWSPSDDNVAVTGYTLYRGGTPVESVSGTTGIVSGLACGTSYTLAVDAVDAAGNRSPEAVTMVSTTACSDTQAPSTPTGLETSNVSQTSLSLAWLPSSDNVGVAGYDVYRNGAKVGSSSSTSYPQSGLTCGTPYTLAVAAYDSAGNRSPQGQISVSTSACSPTPPPPPPPSPPPPSPPPPSPPPPPPTPTGVIQLATGLSATILAQTIAAAPAGPITVRPASGTVTVTGGLTLARAQVTLDNLTFTGTVTFNPGQRARS